MSTPPTRVDIYAALAASGAGHLVHNLAEFPIAILWGLETLFPLAVTLLIGLGLVFRPGRATYGVTVGWAIVVLVFGGGSVLPFDFLPFVPEQTLSHYLAHLVYALSQLPLLWVGYRGLL